MEKERILIIMPMEEAQKEKAAQLAPDAEILYREDNTVTDEELLSANIIFGKPAPGRLTGSKNLRWLQLHSAGTEGFCDPGVLPENTLLTNATGCYGPAISEHLVAMTFALQKRLDIYQDQQRQNAWIKQEPMMVSEGATVLVIGLGDIGSNFARRMKAMGSYIIGIRKTDRPKPDYVDEQYTMEELHNVLPRADIISLSLPGYGQVRHTLGREEFALMKKTAIVLNVGRGMAVDTDALCEALNERTIYGAGVDVTDPEPLPADHPLWNAPHMLITPHVSGGYALPSTLKRIQNLFLENLEKYKKGETLRSIVDFTTGYAKK